MDFAALIEGELEKRGENVNSFEALMGWKQGFLRSYVRGDDRRSVPTIEKAKLICDALGLDFYIGPKRQPADAPVVDPSRDDDFTLIQAYPVEASAGPGATAVDVAPDGALAFRKAWLSRRGISAASAALLRARGDSMQPVIWDGDLLLVDRSKTTPQVRAHGRSRRRGYQEDVYVVELHGDLRVKAIRRPDEDRLILVSENRLAFDPEVLKGDEIAQLRIVGKVVWWGHSVDG